MTTTVSKICVICGTDTSHIKRVKDTLGRYYCQTCYAEHAAKTIQTQAKAAPVPKFTCFHCGEKFLIDDVWEENGVITCKPCYDKQLAEAQAAAAEAPVATESKKFTCTVCSGEFAIDDCWDIDGTIICKECYAKVPVADAKAPAATAIATPEPVATTTTESVDDWFTPAEPSEEVLDSVTSESTEESLAVESTETAESAELDVPIEEPEVVESEKPEPKKTVELDLEGLPEEFAAPEKSADAEEIAEDDAIDPAAESIASPEPEVLTELPEVNDPADLETPAAVDFDLDEAIDESIEPSDAVTVPEPPARKSGPPTDADLLHEILDRAVTISPPVTATAANRTGETFEEVSAADEVSATPSSADFEEALAEESTAEESATDAPNKNVEVIETIEDVEILEPTSSAEVFDGTVPTQPTYLKPDTQFASEFPSDRIHTQPAATPFSEEPISRGGVPTAATVIPTPFEESAEAQQEAQSQAIAELPAPPEGPTTVDLVVPVQELTPTVAQSAAEEEETFTVDSVATPANVLAIPPELVHAIKDYSEACLAITSCHSAYERIERVRIDLSVARNIVGLNQIIEGLNDTIAKERAAMMRLIECTKVMRRYPYSEVQFARKVALDNPILDESEKSPLQTDPHHFFTTPW